ncbi:MAG: UDP-2,3-diacylglucosamine diphosphatase [Bermanella sp.]
MTSWFISDLHLAPEETRITAGFLEFLQRPQAKHRLYILGDFFNYWVGDDVVDPYVEEIKQALRETARRGVQLFFMHGNRDFLVGQKFCDDSHCTLLPDPSLISLNGESVLLMHGDSLCTQDSEYMRFRAMVRGRDWQQTFLSQSLAARQAFAQKARTESQAGNAMKDMAILDVTPSEVSRLMAAHHVTRMIHGHTHRPDRHDFQHDGLHMQRIVLGDWYTQGWYLKVDEQGYQLLEFELPA